MCVVYVCGHVHMYVCMNECMYASMHIVGHFLAIDLFTHSLSPPLSYSLSLSPPPAPPQLLETSLLDARRVFRLFREIESFQVFLSVCECVCVRVCV